MIKKVNEPQSIEQALRQSPIPDSKSIEQALRDSWKDLGLKSNYKKEKEKK
jgi:hypothetical protein